MPTIPLTKNQTTVVDTEGFERAGRFKWCAMWNKYTKSYYAYRSVQRNNVITTQYLHRFLMGLERGDKRQVDHINHDTLDNQISNLRIVSQSENARNPKRQHPFSRRREDQNGTVFIRRGKWEAWITIEKEVIYVGRFESSELGRSACRKKLLDHYLSTGCAGFTVQPLPI